MEREFKREGLPVIPHVDLSNAFDDPWHPPPWNPLADVQLESDSTAETESLEVSREFIGCNTLCACWNSIASCKTSLDPFGRSTVLGLALFAFQSASHNSSDTWEARSAITDGRFSYVSMKLK